MPAAQYILKIVSLMVLAFVITINRVSAAADINIELLNISAPDSSTFTIPFSKAGNLILIQAKVDSVEGNFMLDTGCPYLVLNLTYFRDYERIQNDEEGSGATSTNFVVGKTRVSSFTLGAVHYYRLTADLANLGNIENSKGVKILGLIGMELLNRFELIIDYEKNLIYLHRIGLKEASSYRHEMLNDTSAYTVVPISISDNRIIVKTTMAGKKLAMIIDSGAETNLLNSRLPNKVFENVSITGRTMLVGVDRTRIEVLTGDVRSIMIGNRSIESLPVLITNLEKTCFSHGGCVDGVLSFDVLSLKKLGFNFVTNKMYIWK